MEVTFFDVKAIRDDIAFLKKEFLELKDEMKLSFASANAKASGQYTSDFFPLRDNASIERFMKEDEELEKRKDSLYLLLSGCDAETPRKFSDAFLRTLFSKDYMKTYIWPLGK